MGFTFDDPQVQGIFTSRGGPVTTVADSTGRYASFGRPSLNDLGKVVFTADLDEFGPNGLPIQGVFTGPDPVADKVLQAGDSYEGVPRHQRLHVQRGAEQPRTDRDDGAERESGDVRSADVHRQGDAALRPLEMHGE